MSQHLHIISLDIPFPVDYGGVVDPFYKLQALSEAGIKIHLHCFSRGRPEAPELNQYCVEVNYYIREKGHRAFSNKLPYIVGSRANTELLDNLLKDDYPILMEGIHCTYLVQDPRFHNRKLILRLHNVEYRYYKLLYQSERSLYKKLYLLHESKLLKRYEAWIATQPVMILAVSEEDVRIYREEFGARNIAHLPVFLPYKEVRSPEGMGCFCLYHGNLSVGENDRAARWLISEVFNDLKVPFVVAGKDPKPSLEKLAQKNRHTCLVANPGEDEMQDMIAKAQIHILPSYNNTGIKLKLLNALYNGRHCVVNESTVKGSGLEATCHIGTNAGAFKSIIAQLYHQPFREEELKLRSHLLCDQFQNKENVRRLIEWIWKHIDT